ncbi:SDR family NAD(P)-dependent oxidoreductase, partial [Acinetobacter baumannii]
SIVVNDLGISVDGAGGADDSVAGTLARQIGPRAIADGGNVADAAAARAMVRRAVDHFGRLDAVINIAGVISLTKVHRIGEAEWRRSIDINL